MREIQDIFNIEIVDIKNLDGDINYSNIKYALKDNEGKKYILKIFPDNFHLRERWIEKSLYSYRHGWPL